jgi:alpha-glucoside transport system substrate-binding protein
MNAKRIIALAATAAVATLSLTGCAKSVPAGDGKVTIYGAYGAAQAAAIQAELDAWTASDKSNPKVTYTALANWDTDIKVKIAAGQTPDIGVWPQPGGLIDASSHLVPLSDVTDLAPIQKSLVPGWDTLAVKDGKIYGLPISANVKSLVFYNPKAFAKHGYTVPTTDDQLTALIAKIKADGSGYPFCAGIESGGATGWPITDWIEQYVLDYYGPDTLNKWVAGTVKFTDIPKAIAKVQSMLLDAGNVNGGGAAMATDNFGDTAPLFTLGGKAQGECFMIRQGSFITDFFPKKVQTELAAGDYSEANVFPLPAPAGTTAGVLGGGDIAAVFKGHNDSDVQKVMAFILSSKLGSVMAKKSSFVSPHADFDQSLYPDAMTKIFGATMANAKAFGFDGSDRMPSAVNAQFWASGTQWVASKIDWATAAAQIQAKY